MNFTQQQARFSRLRNEHAAWHLLRVDNAANILAFVADLFDEDTGVPLPRARAALELELERSRESGEWVTDTPARSYIRQWIQAGWLREFNDMLSKTDACEVALRFATSLDQRQSHATASHLRIVQDAARDLALKLSMNIDERLEGLLKQQTALQKQIDELHAGVIHELEDSDAAEQIRELYQLCAVLTGDFRRVEDEIRDLDKSTRTRMLESENRGDVLQDLMAQESLLAETDSGKAFQGFFELLMDQNRSIELREQLRAILSHSAAVHLKPAQKSYLSRLMRELNHESDRVFDIRRRTEESLRRFVEQGAIRERQLIDQLLSRLEHHAVAFKGISLTQNVNAQLTSGNARLRSVCSWQLYQPAAQLDASIHEHDNSREPDAKILGSLESVRALQVAETVRTHLRKHGPQRIGALIESCNQSQGLEELVAFLRVAQATDAPRMPEDETVRIADVDGAELTAQVPGYLLDASLFPESLEALAL